jgi:hypothetical protein
LCAAARARSIPALDVSCFRELNGEKRMFDGVDLEDSWILGWHFDADQHRLVFNLEASLWPGHTSYVLPSPDKHTCYKQAHLIFEQVANVNGLLPMDSVKTNIDPDGSIDYGNVEGLHCVGDGIYKFSSDFGEVSIRCEGVRLEIVDAHDAAV